MQGSRFAFGPFVLDSGAGTLLRNDVPVAAGYRGLKLLAALVGRPGEILEKAELMDAAWPGTAVEEGNLVKATQMLGREYTILGTVIRGAQLGRQLGFPTANLSAHSEQFPPNGVYVAEARLGGALYRGVANLGFRPTVSAGAVNSVRYQ